LFIKKNYFIIKYYINNIMLDNLYKAFDKLKKLSKSNKNNTKPKPKNKKSLNKTKNNTKPKPKNNDDENMEESENLMGKKHQLLEKIVSRKTRRDIEKEL
jgi:hypothetical protein